MENNENKSYTLVITLLSVIIILLVSLLVYVMFIRKPEEKVPLNPNNENTEVKENNPTNNYPIVKIKDLNTKLSNLDFTNKTTARSGDSEEMPFSISFNGNKVTVNFESYNKTYSLDVDSPISVGAGLSIQGSGSATFYILTSNGKVYEIEDSMSNVENNSNYVGKLVDMGISNASSIAVVDRNFNLSENAQTTLPTVYIRTTDGKVFTDEIGLLNGSKLVEVTEE